MGKFKATMAVAPFVAVTAIVVALNLFG